MSVHLMKKLFTLILTLNLVMAPIAMPLAHALEAGEGAVSQGILSEAVSQSSILIQLKQKLAQIQYRYTLLKGNLDTAKVNLEEVDKSIIDLEVIVANLKKQIDDKMRQSLSLKSQEEAGKIDTADTEKSIEDLSLELTEQKKIVSSLMAVLYVKRNVYFENDQVNILKVLASPDSVSETLQNITYLDIIESETSARMDRISELSTELADKWNELREKQIQLGTAYLATTTELTSIKEELAHQMELLDETRGEKAILESMLLSSDDREEELLSQIRIYESNISMMENSLAETNNLFSPEQQTLMSQIQADLAETYSVSDASSFLELAWPVSPSAGITAMFSDGGYVAEFGVNHYALDVRANQGSEVYAPADGVVQDVIYDPESTRYAYIMIAHRMGVMTVYGHVSSPAVAIGDYVTKGQMIGLSGGMPHTVGSGVRTTGPHLHFEVWQDGVRVDPLLYLPLGEINMEDLSADYSADVQKALEAQIKGFANP